MKGKIPRKLKRFFLKAKKNKSMVIRVLPRRMTDYRPDKSFMYDPIVIVDVTSTSVEYAHIYGSFQAKHFKGPHYIDPIYWDNNWEVYSGPTPTTEEHWNKVIKIK